MRSSEHPPAGKAAVRCRGPQPLGQGLAALAAAVLASTSVQAQVLEIDAAGLVKTYDGPAVFTKDGATAILTRLAPATRHPVPFDHGGALARAADSAALSPAFMEAVAWRESGLRPGAHSRAGAVGEMQLMPSTARALGVDPYDAGENLKGGATYLNLMMRRYDGDLVRALAAYNAGPGAVDRYHGVPPFKETQAYVAAVLDRLSQAVVPLAVTPVK